MPDPADDAQERIDREAEARRPPPFHLHLTPGICTDCGAETLLSKGLCAECRDIREQQAKRLKR